jgi:hypothetical protein
MSGYVVSARIGSASPRLARGTWTAGTADPQPAVTLDATIVESDDATTIQSDVAERWSAIRERWSQLTFFLLDPESWR